jgi:hypothetical protein
MKSKYILLSKNNPENKIDQHYEDHFEPRTHLGLSQCGHECPRYLWLKYHGHQEPSPDGRVLRLFELGNVVEDLVVNDLERAGYTVTCQQEPVKFNWGETVLPGHTDGRITGLQQSSKVHLLEIKSCNDKRYKLLKKDGYSKWSATYKFQVMAYMLGLDLDRCLVVVYNKNTSELYTERIKLDKQWIIDKLEYVFNVITQENLPDGICPNATWWKSRFCGFRNICFK